MFHIITDIKVDAQRISNLSNRKFNIQFKKVLQETVKKWHKEMLPDHFKRSAYAKYPKEYAGKVKRRGKPLVKTGSLRQHLKSRIDISGTSNRVQGRMRYGRPGNPSAKELKAEIFAVMFSRKVSFQQAGRIVGRENSYNPKSARQFTEKITAINENEIRILREFVLDEMAKFSKPTRKIKTIRIE